MVDDISGGQGNPPPTPEGGTPEPTPQDNPQPNPQPETTPTRPRFQRLRNFLSTTDEKMMIFFYLFVLLAHVIDSFVLEYRTNWVRAIIYLVIFGFSWFFIFGKNVNLLSKEGARKIIFTFALSLIAFLLPVLEWELLKNVMDEKLIHILQMWLGFYPSYVLINATPASFLHKVQKIWIGLWIFVGLLFLIVAIINHGLGPLPIPESTEDFDPWESFVTVIKFIAETIWNGITTLFAVATGAINQTQAFGEGRIDYATGGYYTGNEESVEEQGLFIENVEFSKPEYYENETIELFYNLEMKTPTEKNIDVQIDCLIEGETEEDSIIGIVDETPIEMYNNEVAPLSCVFEDGLPAGNFAIKLRATHEYETTSRIETHFIDIERKNAYRAEGIDILDEYGKDSSPEAIYTQGPMSLGIEVGTQPIGISSGSSGPRIGFTLEGDWDGKIKSVETLQIKLPEGLVLDEQIGDCSNFVFTETKENQNVYTYNSEIDEIEEYRSFNCKTKVSNFDTLMGDNEISTKYIKVEAQYAYQYEETEKIEII